MITIINEKEDQAQDFSKALGGETGTLSSDATLPNAPYQIVYASGHLLEYKDLKDMVPKDEIPEFTTWDYEQLPFDRTQIKFAKVPDKHKSSFHLNAFQKALSNSNAAVIATDNDPSGEGDMIGWEIIEYCGFNGPVYRCENFEEKGIKWAFKHLRKVTPQDGLLKRAEARQKFDFLTIQYTRVATTEAKKHAVITGNNLVLEGRLKSSMTHMIGEQERAHNTFKPHSTFIPALFDEEGHKFIDKTMQEYKTKDEAKSHLDALPRDAKISLQDKEHLATTPPKMMDLSTVSARLEKQGYSSKEVQKLAETMYQAHYLSYPRTEDSLITPEQLQQLLPYVNQIAKAIGVDTKLIHKDQFNQKMIGKPKDHVSHGANRPNYKKVPQNMNEIKAQFGDTGVALYTILAKSFLAEFADPKLSVRFIYADDKTGQYKYRTTITTDPGWEKIIKPDRSKKDKDDHKELQIGAPLHGDIYEKKAVRPGLMTWGKLNNALKSYNIGTGATRLQTYNDLKSGDKNRRLIKSSRGKLQLTRLGTISYMLMIGTQLGNYRMTKQLEDYLKAIQKGKGNEATMLKFFDKIFVNDKQIMLNNQKLLDRLPKLKNVHGKVKGLYKIDNKEHTITDGFGDHKFTQQELTKLFNGESIRFTIHVKNRLYYIEGKLEQQEKYGFNFKGHFYTPQVTGMFKPKNIKISFAGQIAGHTFTQDEVNTLLSGGEIELEGISRKTHRKFTAHIKLVYALPYKAKPGATKIWQPGFVKPKKLMASGIFKPKKIKISFAGQIAGHKFTQDEINTLLEGKQIELEGTSRKTGKKYIAHIKLAYALPYKAKPDAAKIWQPVFVRAKRPTVKGVYKKTGETIEFSAYMGHHKFTEPEVKQLLEGKDIEFSAKSPKTHANYTARVKLVYDLPYHAKPSAKKIWQPKFDFKNNFSKGKSYKKKSKSAN